MKRNCFIQNPTDEELDNFFDFFDCDMDNIDQ